MECGFGCPGQYVRYDNWSNATIGWPGEYVEYDGWSIMFQGILLKLFENLLKKYEKCFEANKPSKNTLKYVGLSSIWTT